MLGGKLFDGAPAVVGIFSPSAPSEPSRLAKGLKYIEDGGWSVRMPGDPSKAYGTDQYLFSSDTSANRIKALTSLLEDREVKFIWCTRGAYGSMELLQDLPVELIASAQKPIVGFSDVTALLLAFEKLGAPAVHATSVEYGAANASVSPEHASSVAALFSIISTDALGPKVTYKLHRLFGGAASPISGSVTGGNLSLVCSLLGTPWEVQTDGKLLFLEEVGESPYRLHRMLLQLRLAGKFRGLRGVIFGHLTNCTHSKGLGPDLDRVLVDVFEGEVFPVFRGVPSGHEPLNLPVIFGREVEISSSSELSIPGLGC